jgi:hypothetical protein
MLVCKVLDEASLAVTNGQYFLENDTGNVQYMPATAERLWRGVNRDAISIMKEVKFKLGANDSNEGNDIKLFDMWLPMKGSKVYYDGAAAAPPVKGKVMLFFIAGDAANDQSGQLVELSFASKFYYKDV